MGNKRKVSAQSISEYSLFVAIILVVVIAMNVYVKRGLQGKYADMADFPSKLAVSQAQSANSNYTASAQYEPYYVDNTSNVDIPDRQVSQKVIKGGKVNRYILSGDPTVANSTNIEGSDADKD